VAKPFGSLTPSSSFSEAVDRASRSRKIASLSGGASPRMVLPVKWHRSCWRKDARYWIFQQTTGSDLETAWYGTERSDQTMAATAVYGLPELYRDRIAESQLIGCPGYPTASLLALSPLLARVNRARNSNYRRQIWHLGGRQAKVGYYARERHNSPGSLGSVTAIPRRLSRFVVT